MKTPAPYFVFLLLVLSFSSNAQLCTGSLGDPIVNITFGAGSNPGPQLSAAAIGYGYTNTDCPGDGWYTIRNSTSACFGNSWHTVTSDHTGNPGGYFMLVNASHTPGDFYVDTVKGLCAGTTYQFSAWLMNVLLPSSCGGNGNRPNITFSIEKGDGTIIQQYNTGNINATASPTWLQQGFYFVTPNDVSSVVLRLRNNAPGGCGNDLALDDITFRPCGPVLTSSIAGAGLIKEVCEGDTTTVFFQSSLSAGYTLPRFQWQEMNGGAAVWQDIAGANSSGFAIFVSAVANPGDYYYRVTAMESVNAANASCRVASQMLVIRVKPKPAIGITNPGYVCTGDRVQISATGGTAYQWQGPSGFTSNASSIQFSPVTTAQAGKYYVTITDAMGCNGFDSTSLFVDVKPDASVSNDTVSFCKGGQTQLSASGGSSYSWWPSAGLSSPAIASPTAAPADSTYYRVIVSNSPACSDTAYVQVNVHDPPKANAGPDKAIMEGESVTLDGAVSGTAIDFAWSPDYFISDMNAVQPIVMPPADTMYILRVSSTVGCGEDADSVKVKVMKKIVVPNVFTPNGDGINDLWFITGLHTYDKHSVKVFNSYGQLVFESQNYLPWNGSYKNRPVPVGTYYYVITASGRASLSGYVDVIR